MSNPHRALIERYLTAYNAFDVEGMLALLDRDVTFENRAGGQVTAEARGCDEFRRLAEHAATLFNDTSAHVELRVIPTTGSGSSRTVYRPDRGRIGPPVTWMPDGARLVFKLESGEQRSLWSISVRGGEPVRLLSDCCAENHVRINPDGRRLAFASGRDRGEVWVLRMPGLSGLQRPRE